MLVLLLVGSEWVSFNIDVLGLTSALHHPALQSLRVYALYSGSKRIAALMTAVGLLLGGVCVVCGLSLSLPFPSLNALSNNQWGISDQAALAGKPTELGCHAVTTSKTS